MINYNNLTNEEINKRVYSFNRGLLIERIEDEGSYEAAALLRASDGNIPDYCNSWGDMGPIIQRDLIMLNPLCADNLWKAEKFCCEDGIFKTYATCHNKNPLRAAAIACLMANEVKK